MTVHRQTIEQEAARMAEWYVERFRGKPLGLHEAADELSRATRIKNPHLIYPEDLHKALVGEAAMEMLKQYDFLDGRKNPSLEQRARPRIERALDGGDSTHYSQAMQHLRDYVRSNPDGALEKFGDVVPL